MTFVALATEDELSEAVGKRLLIDAGYQLEPDPLLRRNGSGYLRSKMDSWYEIAKRKPVFLLTDLDRTVCPAELRAAWIGNRKPSENLVMRVAVREIEAWLLADHQALKTIVGSRGSLPVDPDALPDPKQYFLRLRARSEITCTFDSPASGALRCCESLVWHSHTARFAPSIASRILRPNAQLISERALIAKQARRDIREELVADTGAIASQGIGYNARLSHLVATIWSPERAALRSRSLQRARIRLSELVQRMPQHQD